MLRVHSVSTRPVIRPAWALQLGLGSGWIQMSPHSEKTACGVKSPGPFQLMQVGAARAFMWNQGSIACALHEHVMNSQSRWEN